MSERSANIDSFLAASGWGTAERHPLAGDASFRRYIRLRRDGARAMLMDAPPPQENVASTSNPAWPESPEERLARIRAEATENQDNRFYKSPVERDIGVNARSDDGFINPEVAKKQREEYFKRRAASVSAQGTPTQRRYLSEPPTTYRQPADTAPTGVLGDDEAKKAREAKKAAQKGGGGFDLGRLWPWGG